MLVMQLMMTLLYEPTIEVYMYKDYVSRVEMACDMKNSIS
jgi:hypothetical protein